MGKSRIPSGWLDVANKTLALVGIRAILYLQMPFVVYLFIYIICGQWCTIDRVKKVVHCNASMKANA